MTYVPIPILASCYEFGTKSRRKGQITQLMHTILFVCLFSNFVLFRFILESLIFIHTSNIAVVWFGNAGHM